MLFLMKTKQTLSCRLKMYKNTKTQQQNFKKVFYHYRRRDCHSALPWSSLHRLYYSEKTLFALFLTTFSNFRAKSGEELTQMYTFVTDHVHLKLLGANCQSKYKCFMGFISDDVTKTLCFQWKLGLSPLTTAEF